MILRESIKTDSSNIFVFILLGDIYRIKTDFDRSILRFDNAIAIDSTNPNIYRMRSLLWRDMQKYSNVIQDLNKALQYGEEDGFCYVNRGVAFDLIGQPENAISDFKKAVSIDSLNPIVYYNLGRMYLNKGIFKNACQYCSTATVIQKDYLLAFDCYGAALYNMGKYAAVKKAFLNALNISSDDSIAYFYLNKLNGK